MLSDQVESQTEKITDLERVLDDKQGALQKTEDVLARELLEKSALETARLGLLSEITDMRLRQVDQVFVNKFGIFFIWQVDHFFRKWIICFVADRNRTGEPRT